MKICIEMAAEESGVKLIETEAVPLLHSGQDWNADGAGESAKNMQTSSCAWPTKGYVN
jgi:hypothetical protein